MPNPVQMNVAYEWTCDECGRQNFCSAVPLGLPREEAIEYARKAGHLEPHEEVDPDVVPQWQSYPKRVTCVHCSSTFPTEGSEHEDDE